MRDANEFDDSGALVLLGRIREAMKLKPSSEGGMKTLVAVREIRAYAENAFGTLWCGRVVGLLELLKIFVARFDAMEDDQRIAILKEINEVGIYLDDAEYGPYTDDGMNCITTLYPSGMLESIDSWIGQLDTFRVGFGASRNQIDLLGRSCR